MSSEPKKLIVLRNRFEADHLVDILKRNDIPAYVEEFGAGSLYGSYIGVFGDSGVHVFVPEQAFDEAKEIVEELNLQDLGSNS